jgi:hypothetical protein
MTLPLVRYPCELMMPPGEGRRPASRPYSAKCVEVEFSEVRLTEFYEVRL